MYQYIFFISLRKTLFKIPIFLIFETGEQTLDLIMGN